nr:MAG TPA: peptidase [Caudoviricetes sp.]
MSISLQPTHVQRKSGCCWARTSAAINCES